MDYVAQIEELQAQAHSLPEGPTRVALFDEAVALADAHNDAEQGFAVRQDALGSAMAAGQIDKLLVYFAWCLGQSERDPRTFPEAELLWSYRWVVNEMTAFPQISRQQIDDALADMRTRYERFGSTLRSWHLLRRAVGININDHALADDENKQLPRCRRDSLSDDHVTEHSFEVSYLLFRKEYDAGLRLCQPFLKGLFRSAHFEATNCGRALVPLMLCGRWAEAEAAHRRGFKTAADNPRYINRIGSHLSYLGVVGRFDKGRRVLVKHLPVASAHADLSTRGEFLIGAVTFVEAWRRSGATELLAPAWAKLLPYEHLDGRYPLAALAERLLAEADEFARRFDARNGNGGQAAKLAERHDLLALTPPTDAAGDPP